LFGCQPIYHSESLFQLVHDFLAYKVISSSVNSDTDPVKYLKPCKLKDNIKRTEQTTRRFAYEFVSMFLLSTEVASEPHRELFLSPECTNGVRHCDFANKMPKEH